MTYLLSFLRRQESSLINLQLSNISVKKPTKQLVALHFLQVFHWSY